MNIFKKLFNFIRFRTVCVKITKNYYLEFTFFSKWRSFSGGLMLIDLNIDFDCRKFDHCPTFRIHFFMLNFKIFEFEIYNINHQEVLDYV